MSEEPAVNKIITFLGTSDYQPTTYHYKEQPSSSVRYFALALDKFFPDYQITVLATSKAQEEHGRALRDQLEQRKAGFCVKPVPELVSETELWNTFAVIEKEVRGVNRLIFDITHSFRSLPFLAFLALAYLRVIYRFELEAVLYAPLDSYTRSQVYDLSRFVDLLDWTTATHLFLRTGHAALLVDQLQRDEWLQQAEANKLRRANPEELERTSAALRLARPDEARRSAANLSGALGELEPELDLKPHVRPFGVLLKRVEAEFRQITPQPPDPDDLKQELQQELELIRWNRDRGQLMSAVMVAREWLVSLMCWHAGWTDLVLDKDREGQVQEVRKWRSGDRAEKKEQVLGSLNDLAELASLTSSEHKKRIGSVKKEAYALWQRNPAYAELLGQTWKQVSRLRDDLAHAGKVHTTAPRPLEVVLREAQHVPELLQGVSDQSGLETS